MLLLIGIGFLAGIVTAISPCVLPVLPILLAGGVAGPRPLRIIGGLVLSFSVFTLFASWILDKLGLPQDLLRNLAIALLFVMAAVLLVPQLALWLERSLAFFSRLRPANAGGGFFLGVTLGPRVRAVRGAVPGRSHDGGGTRKLRLSHDRRDARVQPSAPQSRCC